LESLEPGADEKVDELSLDDAERRRQRCDEEAQRPRDAEEATFEIERQLK
jgi:hypothetical protein